MIRCQNVSKKIRSSTLLKDVSFEINADTIVGVVGENGAGKSTLLKLITGQWYPTAGELYVLNERPFNNLFVSMNSIYVGEEMAYPEVLTLREILQENARFYPNWAMSLANRLMQHFHFKEDMYYYELSRGKRSAFNAIIGLCSRVPLTVFDEPTTGMDVTTRKDFYKVLLKDYLNYPRTFLIATHHLEEMDSILERILLLDDGEIALDLSLDEMREYARGVRGAEVELRSWAEGKAILHEKEVGTDELFIVVKNDEKVIQNDEGHFTFHAISPAELLVYLSSNKRGSIDNVFR